ncbi:hypothetical protein [Cetobacterium sp.]|uniref:hypothetical protein n=1 Tax=Cetobacterium sp. TaxID=2071632 RepID=UPI002FC705D9
MYYKFQEEYKESPDEYFFGGNPNIETKLKDLFNILCLIYYADIREPESVDRRIKLDIEVENIEEIEKIKEKIKRLVKFMASEDWEFNFIERKNKNIINNNKLFEPEIEKFEVVALLSGGLDSFTGTYFNKDKKTKFIGFNLQNPEGKSQSLIKEFIREKNYNSKFKLYELKDMNKVTLTQRTRSLFFFGLGIVEAHMSNINKLNIYENGIMSLNPPIDFSRTTTKTTHPKTIYLFNEILKELGLDMEVENTCVNKTKAEMVKEMDEEYIDFIKNTVTCGVGRMNVSFNNSKYSHCGACVPCILRKITLSALDLEGVDNSKYQIPYNQPIYGVDKEIHKNSLFKEYKSAIIYFNEYKNLVKNRGIFEYLGTRKKDYKTNDYLERDKMLKKFEKEVEYFFNKYPEILGKE